MKKIETEIDIKAQPDQVWKVLMDFKNHPLWNPFIKSISGTPREGNNITVELGDVGEKGMVFKPKVLICKENQEFRWKGKLLVRGIFDGEHYFKMKTNDSGGCTFIQGEKFSGLLVPFVGGLLRDTKGNFKLMNDALKTHVEEEG